MSVSDIDVKHAAGAPLSIGALSHDTGVSPRSLRYYEQQGLLTSARTAAGHRRYAADAPTLVALIQRLFAAGFSSAQIRPILPSMMQPGVGDGSSIDALRRHRERLQEDIRAQLDLVDILDEVIEHHG